MIYVTLVTDTAVGIGGTLLTVTTPAVTAAGLATLGATVSATSSTIIGGAPSKIIGAPVPTAGLLEAASPATTVASSVQGVTLSATAGKSTQKINVSAAKPSTVFSTVAASATDTGSSTLIQLGTLDQIENADAVNAAGTSYTIAGKAGADNTKTVVTLTAPAGYFAALENTGVITVRANAANACAGAALATSPVFSTSAAAAAATTITLPAIAFGATPDDGSAPLHICMSVKGNQPVVAGAAQVTAKLGGATAQTQDSAENLAATGLLALSSNGATADVASFFPNALSAYGYSTYLRVVNKGAVSAPISIALIDPSTGVVGTSAVLGTLPAGAATTFTAAQVEAVIGTLDIAARPRLRLTAPTGALQVQSFIQSPNGTFNEVSGVTSSN
ncbi:MAG: hypothetical protein DI603_22310 [Roseateles depolymerans]|uniref:Uncharacterized protein n=1 Tax=Roseateles depolymerans TaxID=76731 RepID=A0A2W5DAD6_9BURK|nr:MAG: hypothetical protein DI603_22310 [Roseateles depolymerans]